MSLILICRRSLSDHSTLQLPTATRVSPRLHTNDTRRRLMWAMSIVATFDEQVGLSYLRGMHINDSKTPLGSKKDRHENIGLYVVIHPKVVLADPFASLFIHTLSHSLPNILPEVQSSSQHSSRFSRTLGLKIFLSSSRPRRSKLWKYGSVRSKC